METKSLRGKVEIDGRSLTVDGRPQDRMVDQVFKEAIAVQIALREDLENASLNAVPVLCLHRSRLPLFNKTVRGVRLASGTDLVRLLRESPARLTTDQVQALARAADQVLLGSQAR